MIAKAGAAIVGLASATGMAAGITDLETRIGVDAASLASFAGLLAAGLALARWAVRTTRQVSDIKDAVLDDHDGQSLAEWRRGVGERFDTIERKLAQAPDLSGALSHIAQVLDKLSAASAEQAEQAKRDGQPGAPQA